MNGMCGLSSDVHKRPRERKQGRKQSSAVLPTVAFSLPVAHHHVCAEQRERQAWTRQLRARFRKTLSSESFKFTAFLSTAAACLVLLFTLARLYFPGDIDIFKFTLASSVALYPCAEVPVLRLLTTASCSSNVDGLVFYGLLARIQQAHMST